MPLYRIIDTNERERGPFSAERIAQRIADGRANSHTKVQIEGSDEWIPLGNLPEFSETLWGGHAPSNTAAPEPGARVGVEPDRAPTKRCAYCGRENEESAAACSGCGTNDFVEKEAPPLLAHTPGASPPATGAHAEDLAQNVILPQPALAEAKAKPWHAVHAAQTIICRGGFRLRVSDTSCRSGHRTIATSVGGAKVGFLAISGETITFQQRLSFAGGFLLALLVLLPAGLLGSAVGYLSFHSVQARSR